MHVCNGGAPLLIVNTLNLLLMKSSIVWIICLFSFCYGFGQHQAPYFKVAYNGGIFINPGLSMGIGTNLLGKVDPGLKAVKSQQELRAGISLSFYHHRRLNTGLTIGPEIQWIRTSRKGFQFGLVADLGYLRTFIPNTFAVNEVGEIKEEGLSGTDHFFYNLGLRFGKDLRFTQGKGVEWMIKPKLQFQHPYFEKRNQYFLLEIGTNFKL